ncbi:Predicted transcriptional regulator, contains HTH domain [Oscillibacter sp. PC13]|uniref:RNA-binding domain-containing protein n=1 Tax=Oscillibacter sp. PC13 TaxID=1855299 RepID=UPI0008ECC2A1|nr:RNA-binding domain-containing protein [Oscillibacter sp. PC13]SFP37730.1 Predicted transcriptional regulator, contains HTH domain [Oscillibacter sp. PC13]
MIDFSKIEQYRENNRIEAKKALGGLPKSIWETYSAFANTYGGIILLGVEELADKSFRTVDLPDPEKLIKEFWNIVNNPNKTSVNVLSSKDVFVQEVDGDHIVVINVPRAERSYKPVYVDGNPLCTYRRNGEGDYRCTKEEYQAMVRDASVKTQDMLVLEEMDMDVFNKESVRSYRQRMRLSRPGHVWEALEDEDFLLKLGAVGIGSDGKKHPTSAGLLMFGNEYDIVREFNTYFLDYQEQYDADTRWTDRIISSSGDWSGNVYDFYFRAYNKLIQDIKVPFKMEGSVRVDDTSVHQALREALANCLVNADYYGRQGLVIIKKRDAITMANPGGFRIGIDAAKSGGVSDPRNGAMLKMFNLIDIGERAGSGIPNIFRVWREQGWVMPAITEQLEPERTILTLCFEKTADKKSAIKIGDKKSAISTKMKESIIGYLTDHAEAKASSIAEYIGLKPSRTRDYLNELIAEGIVVAEGGNRNRSYKLKS